MNTAANSTASSATGVPFALPHGAPAAARTAFKLLSRLKYGTLTLQLPDGSMQRFGSGDGPTASLRLVNWNVCSASLRSGDIGFAESFIAGDWTTPHLTELLRVLIVNRKEVEDVIYGTWLGRLAYRVKHLLNRNTKANSQKNIHAHYDLGNAFYALWLDSTMNYSSAIFETPETSMKDAQNAKVRRALHMAGVQPGDRVLEIGCGWGALAEMAATEFDASVVGVTLSTEQLTWAQQRMARLGVRRAGQPQASTAPSGSSDAHAVASVGAHVRRAGQPQASTAASASSDAHAVASVGAHVRRAGPPQASTAPSGSSDAHAVASVGAHVRRAGPPQASTAPSGGSDAHAVASVGAHVRRAGQPQARTAPSGSSDAHAVASVGAHVRRAGPPQASTAPSGGSDAHAVASVGASYDLRLQDYRDIGKVSTDAPFDAICSIEMVEAVGREYWPTYFQAVARLLKPGGHACVQSIVIADELFERYVSSTDFIQQYIFPGGCLPCPTEFRAQARAAGLEVVDEFSFGQDYAHTLRLWREQFMAQESRVLQLGFDRRFIRIWEFYLAYCEAAFAQANTDVVQYTLRKP